MNMQFLRKLPIPKQVKEEYPVTEKMAEIKAKRDKEIKSIFSGESDKFLLIIGPCSADHREPVVEYISRLARVQQQVDEKILIIPRLYTNKPRTTGEGYMGMLHQPNPDENPDIYKGIVAIRELHMSVLKDFGFTCADEMLYPENHRYLSDLLSYVAVGARSVENQQHRLTASGLDIPVGMKNPISGDLTVMMNSIRASRIGHTFLYRGWEVVSQGNQYSHAILRGFVDVDGKSTPNYDYDNLLKMNELYEKFGLDNRSVIIDTNHNNSCKQFLEQIRISNEIIENRNKNADIKKLVKGLMIESYLEDGAQNIEERIFGKSITDPCLGWEKTEKLILDIAEKI